MNPAAPFIIVDDNHDDLFILKRLLTRAGVKNPFISFDHGDDAIRFLIAATRTPEARLIPEAIFSDKSMPQRNGFDLLKWLRQQAPLERIPFVMFTSVAKPGDAERALELGASAFFEKFPAQHVIEDIVRDFRKRTAAGRRK